MERKEDFFFPKAMLMLMVANAAGDGGKFSPEQYVTVS